MIHILVSLVIRQPGHEADHPSPSSADVKNVSSYTSTLPYIFMTWCLVMYSICFHGMVLF